MAQPTTMEQVWRHDFWRPQKLSQTWRTWLHLRYFLFKICIIDGPRHEFWHPWTWMQRIFVDFGQNWLWCQFLEENSRICGILLKNRIENGPGRKFWPVETSLDANFGQLRHPWTWMWLIFEDLVKIEAFCYEKTRIRTCLAKGRLLGIVWPHLVNLDGFLGTLDK